jgi:ribonuclease J
MTMARFQTYLKDSDVVVTIHRGIDQIGGCITEISTKTSCVFVDFGQNLLGCTVPTTPEQDEAQVRDIFAQNVKQHQAVVYMPMKTMSACLT